LSHVFTHIVLTKPFNSAIS